MTDDLSEYVRRHRAVWAGYAAEYIESGDWAGQWPSEEVWKARKR